MKERDEKLMLVICTYPDWGYEEGKYYWAVSEYNGTFNRTFYKVIHNVKDTFLHCPSKDSMLECFDIISEKDISFEEKQKWAYGNMKGEHPEYFPPSEDIMKTLNSD